MWRMTGTVTPLASIASTNTRAPYPYPCPPVHQLPTTSPQVPRPPSPMASLWLPAGTLMWWTTGRVMLLALSTSTNTRGPYPCPPPTALCTSSPLGASGELDVVDHRHSDAVGLVCLSQKGSLTLQFHEHAGSPSPPLPPVPHPRAPQRKANLSVHDRHQNMLLALSARASRKEPPTPYPAHQPPPLPPTALCTGAHPPAPVARLACGCQRGTGCGG